MDFHSYDNGLKQLYNYVFMQIYTLKGIGWHVHTVKILINQSSHPNSLIILSLSFPPEETLNP